MVVRKTVTAWLSFPGKHWSVFLLVRKVTRLLLTNHSVWWSKTKANAKITFDTARLFACINTPEILAGKLVHSGWKTNNTNLCTSECLSSSFANLVRWRGIENAGHHLRFRLVGNLSRTQTSLMVWKCEKVCLIVEDLGTRLVGNENLCH